MDFKINVLLHGYKLHILITFLTQASTVCSIFTRPDTSVENTLDSVLLRILLHNLTASDDDFVWCWHDCNNNE